MDYYVMLVVLLILAVVWLSYRFYMTQLAEKKETKKREEEELQQKCLKDLFLATVCDSIFQACHYYLEKGIISGYERNVIEKNYNVYRDCGGIKFPYEIYERFKKVPVSDNIFG